MALTITSRIIFLICAFLFTIACRQEKHKRLKKAELDHALKDREYKKQHSFRSRIARYKNQHQH